jgi:hypothetical protein
MPSRLVRTCLHVSVALALPLAGSGCVLPTKVAGLNPDIPREATPIAIDAGLRKLDDPETKRRVERMLASPGMRAVERELVGGIVDGSLSALDDRERAERIGAISSRYLAGLLRGFSKEVGPQVAPAVSAATRGAVRGAMEEALRPESQREAQRFVASLAQASVRPIADGIADAELASAMSEAITEELGPALEAVLRDNLGPGLAGALEEEEVHRALGATARVMGREMVLGATDALAKIEQDKRSGDSSWLGRVGDLAHEGAKLASSVAWLLGIIVLGLIVWIVKLLAQARRFRDESEQRAATTRLINEAMSVAEDKPWSDELLTALEERFRADEEALLRVRAARRGRGRKPPPGGGAGSREAPA